jgi:all-trans-retinol dehydrogenase (NAD+)
MAHLAGKKAIVTGGAMGYGFAICKRLIEEGCDVTIWELNEDAMGEAKDRLNNFGRGKVFAYHCDVSDRERVCELTAQAKKDMGQVDILVNNAAYFRKGTFCESSTDDKLRQMEVNFNALLYTIETVLPDMMARNVGHIVNIASGASWISFPNGVIYTASKFAVHGLSDALRLELKALGKKGVKIISVHPGVAKDGGMFAGGEFTFLASILLPRIEPDLLAVRIVEKGLKKNKSVVCVPRTLYFMWMLRGWIPNPLWDAQLLVLGMGNVLKKFKGRPGLAHTDPNADK